MMFFSSYCIPHKEEEHPILSSNNAFSQVRPLFLIDLITHSHTLVFWVRENKWLILSLLYLEKHGFSMLDAATLAFVHVSWWWIYHEILIYLVQSLCAISRRTCSMIVIYLTMRSFFSLVQL